MPRGWKVMFAPTTEEAAEEASQFRFCRMDSDLILVYGRKESELFAVADDAFLDTLTESEKEWLADCITELCVERAQKSMEKCALNDLKFTKAFEEELQAEKEALGVRKEKAGE